MRFVYCPINFRDKTETKERQTNTHREYLIRGTVRQVDGERERERERERSMEDRQM